LSQDTIPIVDKYRGVGIHDQQPQERIERVVKPEIDHVLDDLSDISAILPTRRKHDYLHQRRLWRSSIYLLKNGERAP
jgi:hypothetical protein